MKRKIRKIVALVCVLCLFVTGISAANAPKMMSTMSLKESLEEAGLCKTYYLEDGTKITYAITRGTSVVTRAGWTTEGVASPTFTEVYQCNEIDGNFLYLTTTNMDKQFDMTVTHKYFYKTAQEISITETIVAGDELHTWVEGPKKPDGTRGGLTMKVASTIMACDPYSDAYYKVNVDQFWT